MTRKNVIRIVFQNSDRKSIPVQRTKTQTLQGLRSGCDGVVLTRDQVYRK